MRYLSITSFLMIFHFSLSAQQKPTLIYIGDPMCSWCYGFSPELSQALEQVGDKIEFEMIMGGLRPYNTETMSDLKEFLIGHWHEVSRASGQEFRYTILNDENITYDTEPPSRAVMVVNGMNPDKTFEFFKAVQKAFYYQNKNMHLTETYLELLKEFDLDPERFKSRFESEEAKEAIKNDFERSDALGVRGFPTLLLKLGEEITPIANGYIQSAHLTRRIMTALEK